jgi:3-oxoacyl-[acyl-carrier protein] reductase
MDLQLTGKTAMITGGSKGIGYAIALAFAREGALPILVARNRASLDQAAAAIQAETGIAARTVAMDLGEAGAPEALLKQTGEIDFLVNNAGAIPGGDLASIDDARWREAWELKLFGYINLIRATLPAMQARGDGVIVNIIGMAGVANRASYICGSTANAALIAFTNGLGAASTDHGVRIFGINPSSTRTERLIARLTDPETLKKLVATLPFKRPTEPEEIAHLAVFGCSPLAGYLSGTVINLDGGMQYR